MYSVRLHLSDWDQEGAAVENVMRAVDKNVVNLRVRSFGISFLNWIARRFLGAVGAFSGSSRDVPDFDRSILPLSHLYLLFVSYCLLFAF